MKNKFFYAALLICFTLGFSSIIPVKSYANEANHIATEDMSKLRASEIISTYSLDLNPTGNGSLKIDSRISMPSSGNMSISISLEVYENGVWKNIATWNKSDSNYYLSHSVTYNGTVGKQYRAKATYSAKVGSISDSKSLQTSAKTA